MKKNTLMINSLQNQKVKNLVKLHTKKHRDTSEVILIEGENIIAEAKKEELLVETISHLEEFNPDILVTKDIMAKISTTNSIPRIIGVSKKIINNNIGNKIVVLENIQDPMNLGTIIRSAAAFGYDIVLYNCVDLYSPKVLRGTQGTIFKLNITIVNDLEEFFNNNDYYIYTTRLNDSKDYKLVTKRDKIAIIFGNEGKGVTKEIQKIANEHIFIRMESSVESLNVSVAASIIMEGLR